MTYNFNLGYATQPDMNTQFLSMLNPGAASLNSLGSLTPSVAAPMLMGSAAIPNLPMLDQVNATAQPGLLDQITSFFGKTPLATTTGANGMKTQGLFDMGLGAAQGLLGAYLGFQNMGIAKDTLAQNKRQFDLNFGAQQKTTNAALEDRQRARVASNPGAYASVNDYMAKNGI